jgi:NTE family protein
MEKRKRVSQTSGSSKGYGLCLSGGGARGAFQIGCWRAFHELGLDFEAVAGSSVGALNGAFICQGDHARAEYFWGHVTSEQVLGLDIKRLHRLAAHAVMDLALLAIPLPSKTTLAMRYMRYIRYAVAGLALLSHKGSLRRLLRDGVLDAGRLERTIERYLDLNCLMSSGKTLIISTLQFPSEDSLLRGRIRYHRIDTMKADDIKKLLLASASIPMLFPAVEMYGMHHRDGALLVKAPLRPLYDMGIQKIIAVHLKPRKYTDRRCPRETSIVDIAPSRPLGPPALATFSFNPEKARMHLDMGYHDAMEVLRGNGFA